MDTVQTDTTYKEKNLLDGTGVIVLKNSLHSCESKQKFTRSQYFSRLWIENKE